jgi:tRNA(fMet)-specific endonuclease VapC
MLIDAERAGLAALDHLIEDEDDVAIAAITIAELIVGSELADNERRTKREAFLDAALEAFSVEGYDLDVARAHGALLAHTRRVGQPRGAHDLIIAATARAKRRSILTTDETGFAHLPDVQLHKPPQNRKP